MSKFAVMSGSGDVIQFFDTKIKAEKAKAAMEKGKPRKYDQFGNEIRRTVSEMPRKGLRVVQWNSARSKMRSGSKKLAAWVRAQGSAKKNGRKNPVRVGATVVGKGTGWIKAKAVRVVKSGGRYKVEVKR